MHLARILPSLTLALLTTGLASAQDTAPAAAPAQAPATAPAAPAKGFTATINADNVYVRSGPSVNSAYPFGKLKLGDVVEVEEESYGWAKIRTRGGAFQNIHGYVLADEKVTLSPDGKTLTVVTATAVRAPNIGADGNPDASIKSIGELAPGDTLAVVAQVNGEREKVHKVALPASAIGWVNMNFVRRATQGESQAIGAGAPASAPVIEGASTTATAGQAPQGGVVTVETTAPAATQETVKPVEAPKPAPPVKTEAEIAAEKCRASYKDLEASFEKVRNEPTTSAEVGPMRERYNALMSEAYCPTDVKSMAAARVKQLELLAEAQQLEQEVAKAMAARERNKERYEKLRLAMEARADYTAVGVLNASTVYNGNRLPLLFRVTDPAAGQTVAYVAPKDANKLSTMLGTLVGIRGTKRYDEALKLNIIDPGSIDILTTRKDGQVQRVPIDAPNASK
jgi:uncharacterized protein YgiM (DUF1202 family)